MRKNRSKAVAAPVPEKAGGVSQESAATGRPPADATVRGSEEQFHDLLRTVPGVAVQGYSRDGLTIYWNLASEQLYGYTAQEAIGRNLLDLIIPAEMQEGVRQAIRQMAETGRPIPAAELSLRRKDGSRVAVFSSHAVVRVPGHDAELFCLDIDLTARKQAEAELRESQSLYHSFIDQLPNAVFRKDGAGRYVLVNSQFCRIKNLKPEDFIGRNPLEVAAREGASQGDQGQATKYARTGFDLHGLIMQTGRTVELEEEYPDRNGLTQFMQVVRMPVADSSGNIIGTQGIMFDITARKRAEAALRASEERYQRITAAVTDYIYTVSVAEGRVVETTHGPGCLAVTGYREEDFVHDPFLWFRMVAAEDRPAVEEQARRILAGDDPPPLEHRIIHQNGMVRWVRNTVVPHREEHGTLVGYDGLIRDITERKQAELALRESETTLRESQLIAGLGSYVLDIPAGVWSSSDVLNKVLGIEPAHRHTVDTWVALIHPDDRAMMADYFRNQVLGQRQSFNKEYRIIRHHDRAERWVHGIGRLEFDAQGRAVKMRGTIQDVTKRKEAGKAIAALALRNQTLLQTASDGIHVLDEQGQIVEANAAFCRLLGYSREEILRLNVADWDVQWPREELVRKIGLLITQPAVFETRHRRKDGTLREVEINGVGVTLDGRSYLYASARDITERKQAEAEREKIAAQSQQLQKAESLGRMAGAVAHLFNNQLQAVMLRLEMAIDDLPEDAASVESLTEARKAARKAAAVSTQMLTYLGQSFDKTEPQDLSGVCLRGVVQLQDVMPPQMDLETDLPSPGPSVNANANQIQQVLTNLLTNAWEAGGDRGGTIRLTVRTVAAADIPVTDRFPIDWQPQDAAYACLEVADTGCGIAAQDIEKLFDPFFSSKFTGRGLGLPVVLGIVRVHNGAVSVESELGRGSIFRVFLPAS